MAIKDSHVYVESGIAVVSSHHIGATELAYNYAPVAGIRNVAFRFPKADRGSREVYDLPIPKQVHQYEFHHRNI